MATTLAPEGLSTSVVLPVHNGAEDIGRALSSIAVQTCPVDDIIVVDDGSQDGLLEALRAARFEGTLIRQPQRGQGAATNRGLAEVSTTHVLFLDHDDEWYPDKVEWQLHALARSGADIVLGSVINVFARDGAASHEVDMGPARLLGAGLFRRSAFDRVGLLPEDRRIHEIVDWWSRADGVLDTRVESRPCLRRHVHGSNLTLRPEHLGRRDLLQRVRTHVHRGRVTDADR